MKAKYILSILFAVSFFARCTVETVIPEDQVTEELAIVDEASAIAYLNGVYAANRSSSLGNYTAALCFSGTEQDDIASGSFLGTLGFASNNVDSNSENVLDKVYKDWYKTINNANFLIEKINDGAAVGISENTKNEILAEARALRGLSHFMLLRTFGQFYDTNSKYGIVVREEVTTADNSYPRNTVSESYESIISDFTYAAENAADVKQHYRITKTTAKAFLAKAYLYAGNYTDAATTAKQVIDQASGFGYSLEANYGDVFNKRWESSEVLFSIYADGYREQGVGNFNYRSYTIAPTDKFKNLADEQDGVVGNGDTFDNSFGYDPRYIFSYLSWGNGVAIGQNNKYPFSNFGDGTFEAGNTYYFMRLAEVYLIHAEAEARRSGGILQDAFNSLKTIRDRAGASGIITPLTLTDKEALLTDIRNEKTLELFLETGETWFDLVRYDSEGDITASSEKASISNQDKLIFPIPFKAVQGNNLLEQNPGY